MGCIIAPEFARLRHDPSGEGFIHLGKDGVLRSLSGKNEVVDAIGLNPEQIKQLVDIFPSPYQLDKSVFDGVDGTTLPKEQWYNPASGILPERNAEEASESHVSDESSMK